MVLKLEIYLARHGETEWSVSGRHTGITDLPLTRQGELNASRLKERLGGLEFDEVLTSPLRRAQRTCELAGFGQMAKIDADLLEWNYGDYEGEKTSDIRKQKPTWYLFLDGCPGGESPSEITARADRLLHRLGSGSGKVLLFSHGHFLRVLAARWLGMPCVNGRYFNLSTAALSILGFEHGDQDKCIVRWNDCGHVT